MIITRTTTDGIMCRFELREENGAAWYIDTEGNRRDGIIPELLEILCREGLMPVADHDKIVSLLTGG
ncbi:MAG: hypothetical protein K6F57_04735 [Candidatus Saccharibacteria bacterium]|nr:hypothetical protein [Candidatus Saccharibacteria bacterium]